MSNADFIPNLSFSEPRPRGFCLLRSLFWSHCERARAVAVSTFQSRSPTRTVMQSWGTSSDWKTHVRAARSSLGLRSSLIWQFFKADANCGAFILISTDFSQRRNALFSYLSTHLYKKSWRASVAGFRFITQLLWLLHWSLIKFAPKNRKVSPGIIFFEPS